MSIKNVSIIMIVLSAVLGLLQIFLCKAYSCGFYTISNAFVWWLVYLVNNTCTTQHKTIIETFKLIDLLFDELTIKELTIKELTKENGSNNKTDGAEVSDKD